MISAENVADFLLSLNDPEAGDAMSNLKLQKLLYYSQGFHLAIFDKPLFTEKVKAWQYGPVVEEIYNEFSEYSYGAIPIPRRISTKMFTEEQKNLLKEIYEVYGQFSALRLMQMTHSEPPVINTDKGKVISHEKMKSYFKKLLEK